TLYKLIVLYMLQKVDFPLTGAQIFDFILLKGYTNYFTLQQAISEMTDSNLIKVENTHHRSLYKLSEEGLETIQYFQNKLPPAIRQDIDAFLKEKQFAFKEESSVKANYFRNSNHEYSVCCQIQENGSDIINITINVPNLREAEAIINNWNLKNQDIYAYLMKELL
ncbi:MAG: DUF4364 family protein, partial [Lachnospiraceae bacterium]